MTPARLAVFDCNVLLQTMLSERGPAHACYRHAVTGKLRLVISPFVLAELRELPTHPQLRRFAALTSERVDRFILDLLKISILENDVPPLFALARDPDDAHYVNLALKAGATLIISRDRDLRDLGNQARPEGREFRRRFPALRILDPSQFLTELETGTDAPGRL
jgi:putative PIN family toxin of toxin-antitoxin system